MANPLSIRLSTEGHDALDAVIELTGLSKPAALDLAIRHLHGTLSMEEPLRLRASRDALPKRPAGQAQAAS